MQLPIPAVRGRQIGARASGALTAVMFVILLIGVHSPSSPSQRWRLVCAQGAESSEMDYGSRKDAPSEERLRELDSRVEELTSENARLKKELRKLETENGELKSWPDYGESVLDDDL